MADMHFPLNYFPGNRQHARDQRASDATSAQDTARFDLAIPRDARRPLAMAWLSLGLVALLASGLFSILLVLSRTPQLQALFPVADFFRVALVVHVDLSVLVWFLAYGGALWTISGTTRALPLAWAALALAAAGTLAMCLSPFIERANPVMANYVPVLEGSVFLAGLVMFGGGVTLLCLRSMLAVSPVGARISGEGAARFGLNAAMVAVAVSALAFAWSWIAVPASLDPRIYYELIFWGGGHVLQFAYTLLMLVGWLWLASAIGAHLPLSPRVVTLLFAIALLSVFLTPITYLAYDVTSVEHHRAQTLLMRFGGGLVIAPIALAVVWSVWNLRAVSIEARPLRASLIASLVLFSAGGVIGFLITGSNVRIPAHYHGCIVGVTLAMMGVVYHLLPKFGFAAPRSRYAAWQPGIYGAGQLMHIIGLVWSGGYGVQRKVAGAEQVLRSTQETLGMGLMGFGGLVAIIGGVMFVVIVLRALRTPRLLHPAQGKQLEHAPVAPVLRMLRGIGGIGAVLAVIILAASVLLRLNTQIATDGHTFSVLTPGVEGAARLLHRLAASGIGLLAVLAAIACGMNRQLAAPALRPTLAMVAATVVLAVIGPLTPGYKFAAVTVANVVGGVMLVMSCWWLRESLRWPAAPVPQRDPLLRATVLILLLHTGTGAAASAMEMHGLRWISAIHLGLAILATMFLGSVLWQRRHSRHCAATVAFMTAVLAAQLALGVTSYAVGHGHALAGFAHALLTPLLAAGLVTLAVRNQTPAHMDAV